MSRTFSGIQGIVKTTKEHGGINITATVAVTGLPNGCTATSSEAVGVAQPFVCGLPLDEYGPVRWREEQIRLDDRLIRLSVDKEYTAYIHIKIGPTENETTMRKHIERIVQHFRSRDPKLDLVRVVFAVEKDDESTRVTRFYVVPPKADFPSCSTNCTVQNGREFLPKQTPRPTAHGRRS